MCAKRSIILFALGYSVDKHAYVTHMFILRKNEEALRRVFDELENRICICFCHPTIELSVPMYTKCCGNAVKFIEYRNT